jgi:hypothetical protein
MGFNAMECGSCTPLFFKNLLPPSSTTKTEAAGSSKTLMITGYQNMLVALRPRRQAKTPDKSY